MSITEPLTPKQVNELVMANRVIRSPVYQSNKTGIQWGADIIPTMMDLFQVDKNPRDDHVGDWIGFGLHWEKGLFKVELHLEGGSDDSESTMVLTGITVTDISTDESNIFDDDYDVIELPKERPTKKEWSRRQRQYQKLRSDNDDDQPAVRAFIACLSGWQREVVDRIDEIIREEASELHCAIKWHAPFYGVVDQGWFAQIGILSKYVKLTFIKGTSLDPEPPVEIRNQDGRCVHIFGKDNMDEKQIRSWIKQATAIPGWLA